MTSSSGARSASAGVDRVEQAVARARVVGGAAALPSRGRLGAAGLRARAPRRAGVAQGLGERLEGGERLLRAAAEQDGGAVASAAAANSWREPGLADAGLAGEQHEPPVAVRSHAGPRRPQALELGAAADERVAWVRSSARGGATGRSACAAARRAARASRATAGAEAPRRRSANRSPAAARRRGRRAASRSIRRRFGSSASGSSATCSRVRRIASAGCRARDCSSASASRCACAWRASWAQSSSKPSRIGRGGPSARGGVAGGERRVERARVDARVERRPWLAVATSWLGRRPERAAQLGQRGAQAGAGGLVEHVGPEARGELGARVRAGVQRRGRRARRGRGATPAARARAPSARARARR